LETYNRKEEGYIVKKMIEGDHDAFKYFFDTYYDDLCNFVNMYVRNEDLAEEIVQGIYVYMWENKDKLKIKVSFRSYLYSASKFQSLNLLRNKRSNLNVVEKLSSAEQQWEEFPKELFMDIQTMKNTLNNAISRLPQKCREIFLLSKVDGLSHKKIAEKLNISVKTVENQITIAFKKLRALLLPYRDKLFFLILIVWLHR
jgi:RNA polymerase sigma-70 factor, ECF subfamily